MRIRQPLTDPSACSRARQFSLTRSPSSRDPEVFVVYLLAVVAALVVASGEVVQQRTAAQAPPEDNLSLRLLWWLVRRPRWLAGVGTSLVGNLAFAAALTRGSVILVESVFVLRLVFGLAISATLRRERVPALTAAGAVSITLGLVAFLLAATPRRAADPVEQTRWLWGAGGPVVIAAALAVLGSRRRRQTRAMLLAAGAGVLFGLQAALVQNAVRLAGTHGPAALLTTWRGYAVVAVALTGMLLVQSAFESAPLGASYPPLVVAQLVCAIGIGMVVLGGSVRLGPAAVAVSLGALAAMVTGMVVLGRSPLVVGRTAEGTRVENADPGRSGTSHRARTGGG